ncbi:FMN reductase [NAD(P)H] [Cedecea neteri]|uniref:FMN reductase [NAD(P)H] n=1 Tax=Cedecea neteri TaxID=158822 RepID=A0A291E609_9ENTR|nr:nitroreductase family protein [Cedecea neteri]ATF95373.1 NADPH-dependent oxidoreductase [Cedecea neteri]SQC91975.1 FMN reductase [NAD(P)H] [Cedecea neteri]
MDTKNTIIDLMLNRRSIRHFTGETVNEIDLMKIIQAAQQSPSSINGQQVSLIITRDKKKIKNIAQLAGGQPQVSGADVFITVVIDFYRTAYSVSRANTEQIIEQSAEGIVVGTFDAGIMLNALQTAAESLGYGTTVIGGIRHNPEGMIKLLGLPSKTYPIVGMTLGVIDKSNFPEVKPRVPLESFAMNECYDSQSVKKGVDEYDLVLRQWWDRQGLTYMKSYNDELADAYSANRYDKISSSFIAQGFKFE